MLKSFLPSLQRFWPPKKSLNDKISQRSVNNTFLCNIRIKPLWNKYHNKPKHIRLFWAKKFILRKYYPFSTNKHDKRILQSIGCFSKPKKHITSNYLLHNLFCPLYLDNIGLFYLRIWNFSVKKLSILRILQNRCWLKGIACCISLEPHKQADFMYTTIRQMCDIVIFM